MPTLMKDLGETFIPADPKPNTRYAQVPKHNQRFVELSPEITDERTIELSVSSDTPYYRWFGYEELDHGESAVDLSRFNRERTQAILAAGVKYGCTEVAQRAIKDGLSIEQTRSLFLSRNKSLLLVPSSQWT